MASGGGLRLAIDGCAAAIGALAIAALSGVLQMRGAGAYDPGVLTQYDAAAVVLHRPVLASALPQPNAMSMAVTGIGAVAFLVARRAAAKTSRHPPSAHRGSDS